MKIKIILFDFTDRILFLNKKLVFPITILHIYTYTKQKLYAICYHKVFDKFILTIKIHVYLIFYQFDIIH